MAIKHGAICYLPYDEYGYFGWPSIIEHNGRFIVVASGFRKSHFGEGDLGRIVLFTSENGEDWSGPRVIADTDRDDRDAGISRRYGGFQVNWMTKPHAAWTIYSEDLVHWSDPSKEEITAPHGPTWSDRTSFYLGKEPGTPVEERYVVFYKDWEKIGTVPNSLNMNEAHVVEFEGKLIGAMRDNDGFMVAMTESEDGTGWTEPKRMWDGSPPHLLVHNGSLVCSYGYRKGPYGIRARIRRGGIWSEEFVLREGVDPDLGYPASCSIGDEILTVYYMRLNPGEKCGLFWTRWK